MATTFIDTKKIAAVKLPGAQGRCAEILNTALCGAKNGVGRLHWIDPGESFTAACDPSSHQMVYLMEGEGVIRLDGKDYPVKQGAGVYLGPSEEAGIRQTGAVPLKLFQLVVPKLTG